MNHLENVRRAVGLRHRLGGRGVFFYSVVAGSVLTASLSAQSVEELKVAPASNFEVSNTARNPFWPIGWTPTSEEKVVSDGQKVSSTAWFKKESFTVSSISTGGLPLAMINGRPYGEGDFINMPGGTVQVSQIHDGTVQLRFEGRTIEVGLRREQPKAPSSLDDRQSAKP